ncbi:MAG: RNase adapter RapZ [Alphaproteobacteria bacterium]|nr:RNase adapter RapZ [Alphaproteobacteria bacterium]
MSKPAKRLVIVTGLSGAGMSSVLKSLEDMGFEVFDNFPLSLVDALLSDSEKPDQPIAIAIDVRARGFSPESLLKTVDTHKAELLFMSCEDAVLKKRFTETRRIHPLAKDKPITAGIKEEAGMLSPLQERAELVIDTSDLSIHDLKHILKGHFGIEDQSLLNITLMSFGFKHGSPRTADIVMDVRFLKNPHWEEDLREKTGKDADVAAYIQADEGFDDFIENFKRLMNTVLPRYAREGKSYLTIAIGCTGGRHRSVFTVETLKSWLKNTGYQTHIEHRDIGK